MLFNNNNNNNNTMQQPTSSIIGRGEGDNAHWPACGMHSSTDGGAEEHSGLARGEEKTG
jgi:hypothetical protein